ncbi:MAG: hypothetical protein M1828_004632 [Chrysothrix sp. TS-e1954]|nr:MAG: hypothetical protein M1828_004632 [Chrysothrix sp. TS-e1954]
MTNRIEEQDKELEILRHQNRGLQSAVESTSELMAPATIPMRPGNVDPGPDITQEAMRHSQDTEGVPADAPFDSATHHLLSLHESLRGEMDRLSGSLSELDARSSMMIMNENLRVREDLSSLNAAVGALRMQVQWLMSARLQTQMRSASGVSQAMTAGNTRSSQQSSGPAPEATPRRLSDSTKQDTKL